jgi:hypothetical protein
MSPSHLIQGLLWLPKSILPILKAAQKFPSQSSRSSPQPVPEGTGGPTPWLLCRAARGTFSPISVTSPRLSPACPRVTCFVMSLFFASSFLFPFPNPLLVVPGNPLQTQLNFVSKFASGKPREGPEIHMGQFLWVLHSHSICCSVSVVQPHTHNCSLLLFSTHFLAWNALKKCSEFMEGNCLFPKWN